MREVLVLSGKGGTGKTSITGAFAHLAENKILCDLDVDAPDLHLLLAPELQQESAFVSGHEAVIDPDLCDGCGLCASMCRFNAIDQTPAGMAVNARRCEGCNVCVTFCPTGAIGFPQKHCGQWYASETRFGPMVHAQLFPGEENSGRLVMLLKTRAREWACSRGLDLVLCDGAPGIGCPVISSLSGTHLAVAVTEPTPSGRHDLERVASLCDHFRVRLTVIVNKHDLNPEQTAGIESYCREKGYPVIARLPHDPVVTEAMVKGLVITEMDCGHFRLELESAWRQVCEQVGVPAPGAQQKKQTVN
jgi:MinD superfamily P-loop ATPase